MDNGFFKQVYNIVKQIPYGKVMTYGQIARILNNPRGARIVGWALHVNPDPQNIPCHRVINSKGEISSGFAFGGPDTQKKLLEAEGVVFDRKGKVNLNIFLYNYFKLL